MNRSRAVDHDWSRAQLDRLGVGDHARISGIPEPLPGPDGVGLLPAFSECEDIPMCRARGLGRPGKLALPQSEPVDDLPGTSPQRFHQDVAAALTRFASTVKLRVDGPAAGAQGVSQRKRSLIAATR